LPASTSGRQPDWALGYQWDIVLRGRDAVVFEKAEEHR
jgi:hypothetical protein